MDDLELAPISEVMGIIDSCINDAQLEVCERLKCIYSKMAKHQGVVNPEDIEAALDIKIKEKRAEMEYADEFLQ